MGTIALFVVCTVALVDAVMWKTRGWTGGQPLHVYEQQVDFDRAHHIRVVTVAGVWKDVGSRSNANYSRASRRQRRASHLLGVGLRRLNPQQQRLQQPNAVCLSNQCHNKATCVVDDQSPSGFRCQCVHGYFGVHCDEIRPDCESNPCKNNALCVVLTNGFKCECNGKFFGDRCQFDKTTRVWYEEQANVIYVVICSSLLLLMICSGLFCAAVNAQRQALLEKYKWYTDLHMKTPTPTSFCYACHLVVNRYVFCLAFISKFANSCNKNFRYYVLQHGARKVPPQRPNTPVQTAPTAGPSTSRGQV